MAIQAENMSNKVTPLHDLSWYIKWASTIFIILGMITTALNLFPFNMFVHLIGVTGWLFVGILWHDRALIVLNAIAIGIFVAGIVNHYV